MHLSFQSGRGLWNGGENESVIVLGLCFSFFFFWFQGMNWCDWRESLFGFVSSTFSLD